MAKLDPPLALLRLCGGIRVESGGCVHATFRTARVKALLAALSLSSPQRVSRDTLADRLWPELDASTGRKNLRLTLSYLKRFLEDAGLPESTLCIEPQFLALDTTLLNSDVGAFRADYDRAQGEKDPKIRAELLERALKSMDGTLAVALYDDWLDEFRQDLREQWVMAACDLAELLVPSDSRRALFWARQASREDPFSARAVGLIASSLLSMNDRAGARKALRDHDLMRLKELGQPIPSDLVALLERSEAGVVQGFATVPRAMSSYQGREDEVNSIRSWMEQPEERLLTIYGPGGIGKTRIAMEACSDSAVPLAWVELSSCRTSQDLLEQIALATLPNMPDRSGPMEQLAAVLAKQEFILVLDNVEQIPDSELRILEELLARLQRAKLLVTSRKTLGFRGERLLCLEPLPLPNAKAPEESAAYRLFLDRASSTNQGLILDAAGKQLVVNITRNLEGIPLAIELAAARLTGLCLSDLDTDSKSALEVLVAPRRQGERHGAMRTTLQWSFDHIDPVVAEGVSRLAVAHADFDSSAVSALCAHLVRPPMDILQLACEHSLITSVPDRPGRYKMLECTRQFAWERLGQQGQEAAQTAYAKHYAKRASEGYGEARLLVDLPHFEASLRILAERPNETEAFLLLSRDLAWLLTETAAGRPFYALLKSKVSTLSGSERASGLLRLCHLALAMSAFGEAVQFGKEGLAIAQSLGDVDLECEISALLSRAIGIGGDTQGSRRMAMESLLLAGSSAALRAKALRSIAWSLNNERDPSALDVLQEALVHARAASDLPLVLEILDSMGVSFMGQNRLDEAEAVYSEIGDLQQGFLPQGRKHGLLLHRLGCLAHQRSALEQARSYFLAAKEVAAECNYEWLLMQALTNLGDLEFTEANFGESVAYHSEVLAMRRNSGDAMGIATSLLGSGLALLALGRTDEGHRRIEEAAPTVDAVGVDACLSRCLRPCAEAALRTGDSAMAQRLALQSLLFIKRLVRRGQSLAQLEVTEEDLRCLEQLALKDNSPPLSRGAIG